MRGMCDISVWLYGSNRRPVSGFVSAGILFKTWSRTRTRKVLRGSDTLFGKPDTACRSHVGRTPDMNQDGRAASSTVIARLARCSRKPNGRPQC